ncbi:MAG: aminotransferase class I/II-fold pyridoxal phosphate-dependent enzyme [Pseudomonadota bacterium]
MRDFALEVFFSDWEFKARHHMTASDIESLSLGELLALGPSGAEESFLATRLSYTETWGAPSLRRAIAATYDRQEDQNILCLAGAGEGLYTVARVLLERDDHVVVTTPNYQSAETVPLAQCAVTGVVQRPDNTVRGGWRLDVDDIKAALQPNTRLISLNLPNNPTGMLLPHDDWYALIDIARERGIYILCDEVYRGVELDLEDQLPQVADLYERGISLNVLSKAYGLPGLRVGWLACQDQALLRRIERYKHYLSICNAAPAEFLAEIALGAREHIFARNRALLQRNEAALSALFSAHADLIEWQAPLGGCVGFPRYLGDDGVEQFCQRALTDSGILLLPASIYESELTSVPTDRFRIGFGRDAVFQMGLDALRQHLA